MLEEKLRHIHFVGIGGIGMSGIAKVLKNSGFSVSGSDLEHSKTTEELSALGIPVFFSHEAKYAEGADLLVYTSAIAPDNPEIMRARELNIPVIQRAEILGELMRMKYGIAVSGTHGKTTTTSLIAEMMEHAGFDPTAVIGGRVMATDESAKLGTGKYLVAEADESDKSFLLLLPTIAVITNIEEEHLEHYENMEEIKGAFAAFANRVPFYGSVILGVDSPAVGEIRSRITRRVVTYARKREADYGAHDIRQTDSGTSFTVLFKEDAIGTIELNIWGVHNVENALASVSVGREIGIDFETIKEALEKFKGVHRRLEIVGTKNGITLVDDYAHHPTEIKMTLGAIRKRFPENRIISIFQPHRYTRTHFLFEQFGAAFSDTTILVITDIYPASEPPIKGVTSQLIINAIMRRERHRPEIVYMREKGTIPEFIQGIAKSGDIVLTLGAGDIWHIGKKILENL